MDHGIRDPALDAARLVLGDELLLASPSDPLGELVAVEAALAKTPDDPALLIRERQLWRANEERWFGELAPDMRKSGWVEYRWHLGFLDSVTFRTASARFHREVTTSPAARFLRRIVLDLRDCRADEQRTIDGSLADLVAPNLEEFEFRPHVVTRSRGLAAGVASWPRLTKLAWWPTGDREDLPSVLDACPNLKHLALRFATQRDWESLAACGALARLETLDLGYGTIDAISNLDRFGHLSKLGLRDNRLEPEATEALRRAFGDRVEIGTQHPRSEVGTRHARFRDAALRVAAEEANVEDELAVPEAVPYLLEHLEAPGHVPRWVLEALDELGPVAAAASDALMQRNLFGNVAAVDPERGRAIRSDRRPPVRTFLCAKLLEKPAELARHLRDLLDDDDPDVVRFALDGGVVDRSFLRDLIGFAPDFVPLGHIRMRLADEDPKIHGLAAARLVDIHVPEDVERVIAHLAAGREVKPVCSAWLGSHPESEVLLRADRYAGMAELFKVVRRRRCAGLGTNRAIVDRYVTLAFERNDLSGREKEFEREFASLVVRELGLENEYPWAAATTENAFTLESADGLFSAGKLDDGLLFDSAAYGHYANVLLRDPTSAHAAFQIAWIERGHGSAITPHRLDWLRSLGVADALLEELARRPKRTLPGSEFDYRGTTPDPRRAEWALDSELPSIAARLFPADSERASAARAATEEHLARVRAALH